MTNIFSKGDVVKLIKSGGPDMTVAAYPYTVNGGSAECIWIHNGVLRSGLFPTECLIKLDGNIVFVANEYPPHLDNVVRVWPTAPTVGC